MSAAHLHLALNHVPVLGTLFAAAILAYGILRHQDAVVRVALGLLVVSGLGAGVAYLSGEGAEDIVEGAAGVGESFIEAHEEFALIALVGAVVVAIVALGSLLVYRRRDVPRTLGLAVLAVTLVSGGLMGYTANLGGQIRHVEIRPGASAGSDIHPTGDVESDASHRSHDDD